jgi:hypothetical protein
MADSAGHDQATVLEVPVTIQGAKHVDGSEQRQIFTETTKTTIVFGNGAVVNLSSKVAQGQCVFLRNEQTGREILCKVLEWRQVAESGYVDLEFTTRDPKFWEAPAAEATVTPAVVAAPAAAVAPPPAAVVAPPKRREALDMLPASAPAPTVSPIVEASAAASDENAAAPVESHETEAAHEPHEADEANAESDSDAARDRESDDTKDAELLAKLIAKDPKRKAKREPAAAETKEPETEAASDDAPEQSDASMDAEGAGQDEGERRATVISILAPIGRRLHRLTYGKGLRGVEIAAAALIVVALGYAWHAHRASVHSKVGAFAASVPTKQNATSAKAQSSAAPAAAGNSGATPAQAAQKIQQQTGAANASVAAASEATAANAPLAAPSVVATAGPSIVASAPPKLEARESAPAAERETPEQALHRHAKGPNGGETIPARIVAQPAPAIPPWAKGLDTDGVVKVDALIDEKGNLRSTKALSGPRLLQHEAERAVALWIFEPALTDGKPTATHMVLTVQFQR